MITMARTPSAKSHSLSPPLLDRPRQHSFQCCVNHATAAATFSHAPARTSEKALHLNCNAVAPRSPNRAADLTSGPPATKSP